jgi:hypothetical protein
MRFLTELRRQQDIARARLAKARRQHDDLMADAMCQRLADLGRIAVSHGVSA